jgi:hypothetical protein
MPGSVTVYLAQLLGTNPLMALALLICLATILWCILLIRRQRNRLDKILTALVGFIAVYQSTRILGDAGFGSFARMRSLEGLVDLVSASLYLIAAFILKTSSTDRAATRVHLRLSEAGERTVNHGGGVTAMVPEWGHPVLDSSPLAIFAIDPHGMVTYWNPAAESLLGWTRQELMARELPFHTSGPMQAKNGDFLEVAVWTAPIWSHHTKHQGQPQGPAQGAVFIVAGDSTLRQAGLEFASVVKSGVAD